MDFNIDSRIHKCGWMKFLVLFLLTLPTRSTSQSSNHFGHHEDFQHHYFSANNIDLTLRRGMALAKNSTALLSQLRNVMTTWKTPLDAYIVPSEDAHFSEYIAACDERRAYLTGFTGSAGVAVVTQDEALLWTDGRYYIQALEEIDQNWVLMKQGLPDTPTQSSWLNKNLRGSRVGVDPTLYSQDEWDKMSKELSLGGKILTPVDVNLVDILWKDRPSRPLQSVEQLKIDFSGKSTADKIEDIRKEMKDNRCEMLLVTQLDEIAWLLNLRGSDIPYNPVFFAYVLLTPNGFELFMNPAKLNGDIRAILSDKNGNVVFYEYENILERLQYYVDNTTGRIWVSKKCNYALSSIIPEARRTVQLTPISLMKAVKNPVEVQGMINAHIRDGAALCEYFSWLEDNLGKGVHITEISAAEKLLDFRAAQKYFKGMSFPSISSSGPNGAIIHYSPNPATDRALSTGEIYLIDSGGQYLDGTTDVTRTLHFGTPTDFEKDCFTRVLKGSIALVTSTFPNKVVGNTLDTLARKYLWDVGLDYIHGTGHGIGAFLNVHEGPHGISWRHLPDDPGLRENMFVSNEPGYYEEGKFGIRIENIIRITPVTLRHNFANRGYLGFKDVTFAPIQQKMIKTELLTQDEVNYLNEYHAQCRKLVGKYIEENKMGEAGFKWLMKETEPIQFRQK